MTQVFYLIKANIDHAINSDLARTQHTPLRLKF